MLEILIVLGCQFGTTNSCLSSVNAYAEHHNINKILNEFGQRHLILSYIATTAGIMKEQRIVIPLNSSFNFEVKPRSGLLTFTTGY